MLREQEDEALSDGARAAENTWALGQSRVNSEEAP